MDVVRLIGIPSDGNSSHLRGAALAPGRIRAALRSGASNPCAESERDVLAAVEDAGDLALPADGGWPEVSAIEAGMDRLLDAGGRTLALGGDHSVTFPVMRAVRRRFSSRLTVLHFDAHPDLYDEFEGGRLSHACPFARIMEEGLCDRLVQVGIRTINPHQRAQIERFGVEVVSMERWTAAGAGVDSIPALDGPVYVTIDLDALDPSCAPGVSHHEPGGLSTRDIVESVKRLRGVIGADLVEYNPTRDVAEMTAAVCVKLVKELADALLRG
jgi:arginase